MGEAGQAVACATRSGINIHLFVGHTNPLTVKEKKWIGAPLFPCQLWSSIVDG